MFLAYWNNDRKELNYLQPNANGTVSIDDNKNIYIKTNNCKTEYIPQTNRFINHEINLDKTKKYIIHISGYFINNDITFLDIFDSIEDVLQNPYFIDVDAFISNENQVGIALIHRFLLLDTCNALIPFNVSFFIQDCTSINIETNYLDMSVVNRSLLICIEEI